MDKFHFKVTVETDRATGDLLAVYFKLRDGKAVKTLELAEGNALADYNSQGKLLGIELLAPCEVTVLDQIARKEPEKVKQFLRRTAPREMVPA